MVMHYFRNQMSAQKAMVDKMVLLANRLTFGRHVGVTLPNARYGTKYSSYFKNN